MACVVPLLAALWATAAPAPSEDRWITAVIGPGQVDRADSVDASIQGRSSQPAPKGTPWFRVQRGALPIIVTAPHATQPLRGGKPRFADRGTGALAAMLAEAGATALYTTWAGPCDANDEDTCAFKDSLAALLQSARPLLVLDLHASNEERPYDVDFGTMRGASLAGRRDLLTRLAETLDKGGLTAQSLDFFKGEKQPTVTKFVAARKIPCIQLEINSLWLRPGGDAADKHRFAQLLNALSAFIQSAGGGKRPAP